MVVFEIVLGIALLAAGARLFWLFVGAMGFILGLFLAGLVFNSQPEWVVIVASLVLGLIGAGLARAFQQLMLVLAGFVAGGYIISSMITMFHFNIPVNPQILFVLCGLIGAALVTSLFEWAVIVLSSISGATLVAVNRGLSQQTTAILVLVLMVIGIAIQAGWLRWRKRTWLASKGTLK
jgi:hypothetical protein